MMWRALRKGRRWIAIGIAAALGWTAAKVSVPLLARRAVDDGIDPFDRGALLRWTLLIAAVTVVIAVCTSYRRYAAFAMSYRAEADLRRALFAHLQRLHFRYHDEAQTGELLSRLYTDLRQVQLLLVMVPVTAANVVMVVGVGGVLVALDAQLALLSLLPLPFVTLAAVRFHKRLHPEALDLQERLAAVAGVVEESVSGIRVVKGFGAEPLQFGKLRRRAEQVETRALVIARLRSSFTPLLELLPTLGLVVVLFVGGRRAVDGQLTVGELVAFYVSILQLVWPLRMIAFLVAQWSRGSVSAARVYEVFATEPEIVDRPGALPLPEGGGEVVFESVSAGYASGPPVLRDLDLRIAAGESVAVVGATGAGKSTLARLVPRFYDVDAGRILVDGVDVRDLRVAELRRAVGIVFEDTFLFHDTVRANVLLGDPGAGDEALERAVALAGATEFIAALPQGYDTILGEHGYSLSGGQRQRISLARAILADPRILILDDATSSVDPTKEHEIRDALQVAMEGRTTIVIAHRVATIALANRVVLLDDGRIAAEGTHDELVATCPRYREILAQAEGADPAPTPA